MERKFVIITDSASDLPEEYYREHDIECIPLGFAINGISYGGEEGKNLDPKVFYASLRGGAMPTTFQVTPEQAKKHIEKFVKEGKDVLAVAFSSGLSGTANSYAIAARELSEEYPACKILVIDSLCASMGQGLYVDYIVRKADTGASIEETCAYAEDIKQEMCHYFTVEDLFHLKRGGRVSATTAVIGSMLKIKPVLYVDHEGHLIPVGKAMGRKKSISALVEHMKELQAMGKDDPIFISHGDCEEDVNYLISLLRENYGEKRIVVNCIGPVIGAHAGAGTVALFFKGKHR